MSVMGKIGSLLSGNLTDGIAKIVTLFKVPPEQVEEHAFELQKIQAELAEKAMDAAVAQAKMQADVNVAEANSGSWFARNWRPAVGWSCALGLFSQFLVRPFVTWVTLMLGKSVEYPSLDMGTLLTILFGILGIGAHEYMTNLGGEKK